MADDHPNSTIVLVVDDDAEIRSLMSALLRAERHVVRAADSLAEARAQLAQHRFDVIVLDLNLPDGDGIDLCRELRTAGYRGAIVMVSARDAAIDRILGLEFGGDDYLVKPFEARELTARVRSVLRRVTDLPFSDAPARRYVRFGSWRLDLLKRRLIAGDDRLVMLTAKEFDVLHSLVRGAGRVLAREELLPDRLATAAFDRSIDMLVSRLRQKLGVDPDGDDPILTVRGKGYLLAMGVTYE